MERTLIIQFATNLPLTFASTKRGRSRDLLLQSAGSSVIEISPLLCSLVDTQRNATALRENTTLTSTAPTVPCDGRCSCNPTECLEPWRATASDVLR